jgi:hypothetical protein
MSCKILGLDLDSQNLGHFLMNFEELDKAEKILKLFLKKKDLGSIEIWKEFEIARD